MNEFSEKATLEKRENLNEWMNKWQENNNYTCKKCVYLYIHTMYDGYDDDDDDERKGAKP